MKRTIGKIIVGGGLVLALAACGANTQAGSTTGNAAPAVSNAPTAAANSDSSATTPPAAANGAPSGAPGANGQRGMPGVMGTVVAVNGSTLTLQNQRQQGTTTVDLTSSTQIFKQATVDIASITTGKQISAVGSLDGGVFMATQIRIGMAGGAGMGMMGGNGRNGAGNGPGAGQAPNGTAQTGRGRGNRLFGTIDQISGDTITVKAMDGTTTQVKLASNGQITEQVAGATTDITANERIAVVGQENGTTITASQINILPAMMQQP